MWCAYAFAALALVSLPAAIASRNPVIIVQWISTIFLQLVLLSIIIVGQNVQAEATDQRAEADHETLDLLHKINVQQLELIQELHKIASAPPKNNDVEVKIDSAQITTEILNEISKKYRIRPN